MGLEELIAKAGEPPADYDTLLSCWKAQKLNIEALWEMNDSLRRQRDALLAENEFFRTSSAYEYATVYADLVELLGIKSGGSVIEAVEQLLRQCGEKPDFKVNVFPGHE